MERGRATWKLIVKKEKITFRRKEKIFIPRKSKRKEKRPVEGRRGSLEKKEEKREIPLN